MLETQENLIYQGRLHWILFISPICLFVFAITIHLLFWRLRLPANVLSLFAIFWFLSTLIQYLSSWLNVEKKQITLKTGFWVQQTIHIPLSKIESIDIRQTIAGTLFHYGSIIITGTGGSRQIIHYLDRPLTCRRYIEQAMNGY